ncbi:MAG: nucleotidyltransferase family protein [Kiritimatiellae bacterium]|nr:nucleotidyltransferase family protein [Kiritimatiellia bacterium]
MNKVGIKRVAGLIPAAGASSRMGLPKALLRQPHGAPLAGIQADTLRRAGCDPVKIILGANEREVRQALGDSEACVFNERWPQGRVSSIQAGLRAVYPFAGCVLLPVDTVGVQAATIRQMLEAVGLGVRSVRPYYRGERGLLCWISGELFDPIMALDDAAEEQARLDELLRPVECRLDVEDASVLNNINTPEAWAALCGGMEP